MDHSDNMMVLVYMIILFIHYPLSMINPAFKHYQPLLMSINNHYHYVRSQLAIIQWLLIISCYQLLPLYKLLPIYKLLYQLLPFDY